MKKLKVSSPLNLHVRKTEDNAKHVREGLLFHKEMGFDAADFGMGLLDLSGEGWRVGAEQALADSKEIGVDFNVCHLPFIGGGGFKSPEHEEEFNKRMHNAIDAAKILCIDYAVLHPSTATLTMKKYDEKEQYDFVMRHLSPFAEHAARIGVNIVVENMRVIPQFVMGHRFCQTPEELCAVADALGIGVCWDFGHANISGIKQSEGLRYVGKRLKVIHVNDNAAVDDEHLLPFTGNVDWKDAMHGLAIAGYEGVFNFELSTGRLPECVRKDFAGYMINAANELMSYIE